MYQQFSDQRVWKIRAWISNYISGFVWDLITHPCPNFNEVRAWMSNQIPLFYMDVISHPCPNPNADLANLC